MKHKSELLKGSKMNIQVTSFGTQLRHCGNCFTINTAWNTIV
ncbi:hypothetical protein T12_12487 [Trichinella patagoniensis]|uniref:Uncharacterized protein n=1 Tax=Trichinella patagoniensis TaxID=990121 RepID=A0A0V0YMG0_9BILA|nr:hypothetical protein T12_12487 [Trichinella patagoniensis]